MKLFLLLWCFVISNVESKVFKCGIVTPDCVPMVNGNCPANIFCPSGFKRAKAEEGNCCCFARSLWIPKDSFPIFERKKKNILSKSLNKFFEIFLKTKLEIAEKVRNDQGSEIINEIISNASKVISDEMVAGIKSLAILADVEFEDILSTVFQASNDISMMQDESVQSIIKEATEIYDKGESAFREFDKMVHPETSI